MYFNDFKKLVKGAVWVGFGLWVSEDDSVVVKVSKANMIETLKETGEFCFSISQPENINVVVDWEELNTKPYALIVEKTGINEATCYNEGD